MYLWKLHCGTQHNCQKIVGLIHRWIRHIKVPVIFCWNVEIRMKDYLLSFRIRVQHYKTWEICKYQDILFPVFYFGFNLRFWLSSSTDTASSISEKWESVKSSFAVIMYSLSLSAFDWRFIILCSGRDENLTAVTDFSLTFIPSTFHCVWDSFLRDRTESEKEFRRGF